MQYTGDNMPFISPEGIKPGYPSIFHSDREDAVLLGKVVRGGFGLLKPGTILCESIYDGTLVPYTTVGSTALLTTNNGDPAVGKSFVLADLANTATTAKVSLADSYRFIVGESIMFCRNNAGSPAYYAGGAITGIDRTSIAGVAIITFTTGMTDALATTAAFTFCYPVSGVATKYNDAKYILDEFLDTGAGPGTINAPNGCVNAIGSLVLGNAVLYKNLIWNYDTAAGTALGAVIDGQFLYLK